MLFVGEQSDDQHALLFAGQLDGLQCRGVCSHIRAVLKIAGCDFEFSSGSTVVVCVVGNITVDISTAGQQKLLEYQQNYSIRPRNPLLFPIKLTGMNRA